MKRIETSADFADAIVKAACCLHNFLIERRGIDQRMVDHGRKNEKNGAWRTIGEMRSVIGIRNPKSNRAKDEAVEIREKLADFFSGIGAVSWQEDAI